MRVCEYFTEIFKINKMVKYAMTGPEGRKILGKLTSEQRKMLESGKEVTISTAFVKAEWVIKIEDGEIQRSLKIINL